MNRINGGLVVLAMVVAIPVFGDEQRIAPGRGDQGILQIDSGADGLCNTLAQGDDFQITEVGAAAPNLPAVECDGGGGDDIVNTAAGGDDVQLVAVNAPCTASQVVVDTGPDGISDTLVGGDDVQIQAPLSWAINTACVDVGPNGIADTADPVGGDDVRLVAFGVGNSNATVVRCGPDLVADTPANNFAGGDDVQVIAVSAACALGAPIVHSGADGIAQTRAQGPDLLLKAGKRVKLNIAADRSSYTKLVKLDITNVEFGASAPASRNYKLVVDEGSCPGGSVSQVDADGKTDGLQATATILKDSKARATFLVTFGLNQVDTVSKRIPDRCFIDVTAVVDEPSFDEANPDDDRGTEDNNRTQIPIEVFDKNDLP